MIDAKFNAMKNTAPLNSLQIKYAHLWGFHLENQTITTLTFLNSMINCTTRKYCSVAIKFNNGQKPKHQSQEFTDINLS